MKREVRPKAITVFCVLVLVCATVPARAQVMPAPRNVDAHFAAISRAQLETIHYMAHVYLECNSVYPESLQELRDSPYWVVDVFNQYTGLPVQQLPFIPRAGDYASGAALPEGGFFGGDEDESSEPRTGHVIVDEDGTRRVATAGRRIDPGRVEFPSPGDLLYHQEADSLQLVIYDDSGAWQELWMELPFNYRAANLKVTESVRPRSDFVVAEMATHMELLLPGMYNRYLFLTDRPTLTPDELDEMLTGSFEKSAEELFLEYLNAVKKRPFMRADYYSPGDLATVPWLDEEGRFYFLEGERARSFAELTDEDILREHAAAIKRRDKLVAHHAGDLPPRTG